MIAQHPIALHELEHFFMEKCSILNWGGGYDPRGQMFLFVCFNVPLLPV